MQINDPLSDKPPVFIVGCVRSGTTLLRSILGSHPTMCIPRETSFFSLMNSPFAKSLNMDERDDFMKFIDWYVSQRRFKYLGIDKEDFMVRIRASTEFSFRKVFDQLMNIHSEKAKKERWGEKTPGHEFYINLIFQFYPNAKIIYLIRDPRAVSASLKNVPWGGKFIGAHIKIWLKSVREADKWKNDRRVRIFKYEDMVSDVEGIIRDICDFINLPFTAQMIADRGTYKNNPGADWTTQYENSVLKNITTESLNKWTQELSLNEIQLIEHFSKAEFGRWGYKRNSSTRISPLLLIKYYFEYSVALFRSRVLRLIACA